MDALNICAKLCVLTRVSGVVIWPMDVLGNVLVVIIQNWTLFVCFILPLALKEERMIAELNVLISLFSRADLARVYWNSSAHNSSPQVLVADVVTPPPYRHNLFQKIPKLFILHFCFCAH